MHKRRINIPHVLEALFWLIFIAIAVYVFASWFDIIAHNQTPEPVYHDWNVFALDL